jgi:hypothetical protein
MTGTNDDRDSQAQRLERMRNDFLVAQQRRREKAAEAASRPNETPAEPDRETPASDDLTGVVVTVEP